MSEIDNGGPAFPNGEDVTLGRYAPHAGMSLRDYFSAKAMQGLMASQNTGSYEQFAMHAYKMADAMIAERENRK